MAARFSVSLEKAGTDDAFARLAEFPYLWDLNVPDYALELGSSRFVKKEALIPHVVRTKALTARPIEAVGRVT